MDNEIRDILQEIRDLQRAHLDEYKRVTERSLSLQEQALAQQGQAVARQEWFARRYRLVLIIAGLCVATGIAIIVYAFVR